MAVTNFIHELWSASLFQKFRNATVLSQLANREYEGEFGKGNTLRIVGINDVTIKDYKKGQVVSGSTTVPRTTLPEELSDYSTDLKIDQEKSFDFLVDDIDRAQASYSFDAYTESATRGLVEDAEIFLNAQLVAGGTALASPPANPTNWATAIAAVVKLRTALNKAKVPMQNRYLLVNGPFEEMLLMDDSKLTQADTSGSTDGMREATIGRLRGFTVLSDPWLAEQTKAQAVAFYGPALAYVSQITELETRRAENTFKDRIMGLHVYGGKVMRPTAVQVFTATA